MIRLTKATAGLTAAAAATTVAALTVGMSGSAFAAASDSPVPAHGKQTLAAVQQKAADAIAKRLSSLSQALAAASSSSALSATDKAAVLATLNGDVSGLTALGTTIAADTTVAQAVTDYRTVFTSYRVYALALPQSHFAGAADTMTATVLPKLTDAQTRLAALLAGADVGKNTPAVQAAMADLATEIGAIGSATTGLSATVLGYVPAQYNANHALLSNARQSLATARADIRSARADISTVRKALK